MKGRNIKFVTTALAFYALGPSFSVLNFEIMLSGIKLAFSKLTKRIDLPYGQLFPWKRGSCKYIIQAYDK